MHLNDKFGFYQVGDFSTYSKLEAIEHSKTSNQPITWRFNQFQFANFNWHIEPPGSLEDWYCARAQQIRNKYDYVVLWYSGGADSDNILNAFVKNNIFIDEIAQFHNLAGEQGNKQSWMNQEVFETSAPITQQLINHNPTYRNTIHRLIDITDIQQSIMSREENRWDYFYKVNYFFSPNTLARSYLREAVPEYQNLIDQGKSLCFVYGIEKPKVIGINGKWTIQFEDTIDNGVCPRTQMLARNWEHDEYFYWSGDMPELLCKQAHVIKRYLENVSDSNINETYITTNTIDTRLIEDKKTQPPRCKVTKQGKTYHLTTPGLHKLIYPYWNPNVVVCGKPGSIIFSTRDHWFFNERSNAFGQSYYNNAVPWLRKKIQSINPEMWWEQQFDPVKKLYSGGLKPFVNIYSLTVDNPQK